MHDTHQHQWIPPNIFHCVTGTWTMAAGAVSNTIAISKAAADNTAVVTIPIDVPMNDGPDKGSQLISIDCYWEVLTAAMDAVTALIHKVTLPADTVAIGTVESLAFTYDTGHDTAPERLTLEQHSMTLTLTTPLWVEDDWVIQVQLTMDAALTSALTMFGARANFTSRLGVYHDP